MDVVKRLQESHGPHRQIATAPLQLCRQEVKTLVGPLMDHTEVDYHKHMAGRADSPDCRLCGVEEKTTKHIICDCKTLIRSISDLNVGISFPLPFVRKRSVQKLLLVNRKLFVSCSMQKHI